MAGSKIFRDAFVAAEVAFGNRKAFATLVQSSEFPVRALFESSVSLSRIPEVHRDVDARAKGVAQQPSLLVVQVAAKQPCPVAGRAVYRFKPLSASRLDIELPEDYKHKGPVSCSDLANPVLTPMGKIALGAECNNPIGYIPRWSAHQRKTLSLCSCGPANRPGGGICG